MTRTDPCTTGVVQTYPGQDFLAWDPGQTLKPAGTATLGDPGATPPVPGLETSLQDLVIGAGESGCGFESQNEAWYRFLVDPSPYGIQPDPHAERQGEVVTTGTDDALLQQRRAFLRPDSLLAIVLLTDETDTSIKETGQYALAGQTTVDPSSSVLYHLPLPRQDCQTKGPTDPCCESCAVQPPPLGCEPDPTCLVNGNVAYYTDVTNPLAEGQENVDIRAFGLSGGAMSHKARYGIEFYYQPSRYVTGLTSLNVPDAGGNLKPNPIFSPNPDDPKATVRGPGLVFYAAITGVPWQLIARQRADGTPDLVNGLYTDPLTGKVSAVGGFKSFDELSDKDKFGNTYWDDIVGDPESYVPPLSPFMQESTVPRTGTDPITGIAMSPPGSPNGANPINGHEWWTSGVPRPPFPPRPAASRRRHPVRVHLPPGGRADRLPVRQGLRQPALRHRSGRHADLRQGLPRGEEPRHRQGHEGPGHRRVDLRRAAHEQDQRRRHRRRGLRLSPGGQRAHRSPQAGDRDRVPAPRPRPRLVDRPGVLPRRGGARPEAVRRAPAPAPIAPTSPTRTPRRRPR